MMGGSKQLYESTAKKAGIDTTKHTHQKFKEGIGKYKVKMTTDAFIENAMTMMNTKLPLIANRNWAVLHSDRPIRGSHQERRGGTRASSGVEWQDRCGGATLRCFQH